MVQISFTQNLQRHLSVPTANVEGDTVAAALRNVFETTPKLRHYLLDDQGRLRKHVKIFINERKLADAARLSDRVGASDEIFVFQALSGG